MQKDRNFGINFHKESDKIVQGSQKVICKICSHQFHSAIERFSVMYRQQEITKDPLLFRAPLI